MTSFIKKMLAGLLVVMSFACGGQIDDAESAQDLKAPLSFEPFSSYAAARARAHKYASNCAAVGLSGAATKDGQAYQWSWSFQCDARMYVDVNVGPNSVRVTSHETRQYFMGMGTFDPASVAVSAMDLVQILNSAGYARPETMSLSAPLNQKMEPRWTASVAKKTLFVNALSGAVNG